LFERIKRTENFKMKSYTRQELAHLKFRLMTQEGLTEQEATQRVKDLLDWTAKTNQELNKKLKDKGKKRNKGGKATRKKV